MKNTKVLGKAGYTLFEILVLSIILEILIVCFVIVPMANCWFNSAGVLKEIRVLEPSASEIVSYQRNVFRKSVITVKLNDSTFRKYLLDSDILFNYKFRKAN